MGLTGLSVEIGNIARPEEMRQIDLLIDSGAIYSVVPAATLDELGIKPFATQDFRLADGRKISRRKGGALFRFQGRVGGADVIFGEPGDSSLVGAFTLAALGLALDPLRRELHPLPMILAGWRSESSSTER
jgi:aspartyl protease family protein